LDWLETQSTTALRDVRRKEGRRRHEAVGGGIKEDRFLCTRIGNHRRGIGCQGGH